MTDLLQLLVFGIVFGSILTLSAIGVSLIFGILRFAHFAHGDMMTVGAYFALIFVAQIGWPIYLALPAAMVGAAILAILIDQSVYRRLRRTAPVILLISSFGMALLLRAAVQLIWGTDNQVYQPGINVPYVVFDIRIKPDHLVIVGASVILVFAFHLFLKMTRMGKAMRAMSDNVDLARVSGIDSERVVIWTWVIGGSLARGSGRSVGARYAAQSTAWLERPAPHLRGDHRRRHRPGLRRDCRRHVHRHRDRTLHGGHPAGL